MSTGPARRAAETDADREEDATLTLEQWGDLDAPTLRLKCEQYKLIATGKKDVLKQRLFDHFHHVSSGSQSPPLPKTPTRPHRDDSASPPAELPDDEIDLDFDSGDELFHPEPVNHPGQRPPSLTPPPESPNHASDESHENHDNPTIEYDAMTTSQQATAPTITTANGGAYTYQYGLAQHMPPQQQTTTVQDGGISAARQVQLQQTNELLVHEIRALRSEVKNNKSNLAKLQSKQKVVDQTTKSKRKRTADSNQQSQTRPPKRSRTSTTVRNAPSSTQVRSRPPNGAANYNLPVYPGANNLGHYHNTAYVPPPRPVAPPPQPLNYNTSLNGTVASGGASGMYYNPFLPRSVKKELLKKIERGEFVCFEELIPENQTNDSLSGAAGPGIDIDESTGLLKHKRNKFTKVKLNSFQRWCTSWNAFMEAHLHFHPQDYFNLFTYFRLFVSLIQQYKFEACANYDRHFRLRMANQASFAPSQRTVHWTVICDELRSHWLTGHELIRCEYCLTPGHIVNQCRQKRQDQQEGLPQQLAAVLRQQSCWPQQAVYSQQQSNNQPTPPFVCNPSNFQAGGSNRGTTGTGQQSQQAQGRRDPTPPSRKPCTRFNANRHCAKPPCQFGHFCAVCGRANHNATTCYANASTQFQPQPGP